MIKHALLPPSSADKWMVCTGWKQATEGLTSKSSIYADEGTKAHELLEMALRIGVPADELTDNEEMAEAVGHAIDWLSGYTIQYPKARYYIERRLPWGRVVGYPTMSGTSDITVVAPHELTVLDYKHGIGVPVDPATSKQLRIYLLGLIHEEGPRENYNLIVAQPRARHRDGPLRTHQVSHDEIKEFIKEVQHAAKVNLSGKGTRKAGEHCKFCTAAAHCRELATYSLSIAISEFDD